MSKADTLRWVLNGPYHGCLMAPSMGIKWPLAWVLNGILCYFRGCILLCIQSERRHDVARFFINWFSHKFHLFFHNVMK